MPQRSMVRARASFVLHSVQIINPQLRSTQACIESVSVLPSNVFLFCFVFGFCVLGGFFFFAVSLNYYMFHGKYTYVIYLLR